MSKRQGCAVLRLDENGIVVEAAGMKVLEPESILGQKAIEKVPYPSDAQICHKLFLKAHETGSPVKMIVPVFHSNEVHVFQVQMKKIGSSKGIIMTAALIKENPRAATIS